MCIIMAKDVGVSLPPKDHFENMFSNNDDGAGYMFHRPGDTQVTIRKGLMSFEAFWSSFQSHNFTDYDVVVAHFRIGTSGNRNAAPQTHPFPVDASTNALQALRYKTRLAMAHNGILGQGLGELSDTQLFVKTRLAGNWIVDYLFNTNEAGRWAKELIENQHGTGNKMVFLNNQGQLAFTGPWKESNGVKYSNDGYSYNHNSWLQNYYGYKQSGQAGKSYYDPKTRKWVPYTSYSTAKYEPHITCPECGSKMVDYDAHDQSLFCDRCLFHWTEDAAGKVYPIVGFGAEQAAIEYEGNPCDDCNKSCASCPFITGLKSAPKATIDFPPLSASPCNNCVDFNCHECQEFTVTY